MTDYHGDALVATFTNFETQGHRAKQRDMIHVGELCTTTFPKNVVASARVRRNEVTHVLDDPKDWNGNRLKHAQRPAYIRDRHVLRRGHEHGTLYRNQLRKRQLHIARSRRHVHNQVIQLAPLYVREKLFHQPVKNWPAHDHGFIARLQERHRHQFDAVGFDGNQLVKLYFGTRVARAKHNRNVWTINIDVHNSNSRAIKGQ